AELRGSGTRRGEVAALRGSETHRSGDGKPASKFEGLLSRRALLGKTGAAAVAAMAAGTLLYPREAEAGTDVFDIVQANRVDVVNAGISTKNVNGGNALNGQSDSNTHATLYAQNGGSAPALRAKGGAVTVDSETSSVGGTGVRGIGDTGVWGRSYRVGYSGVYGQHTDSSGYGVVGDGAGANNAGVLGNNASGHGVRGEGQAGVVGKSSATGYEGVYGQHTGSSGYGVVGDGTGSNGAGILGRNPSGYGGQFEGGKAQLMLVPAGGAGKPATGSHIKGEMYMDSKAVLWVCAKAGTPGTWRKFTTTAG
ncbi:MAG: twin-arginine translocation signal domain-containing protein, partial [Rubrobacteraceae bacterium]